MIVKIQRYYGDGNITKSMVTVLNDQGAVLWEGEAREPRYVDYDNNEKMKGCSYMCMPRGRYFCKLSSTVDNPMCLRVMGMKGHRGCKLYFEANRDFVMGNVLLGYADEMVPMEYRKLCRVEEARMEFVQMLYKVIGESLQLEVVNTYCEVGTT